MGVVSDQGLLPDGMEVAVKQLSMDSKQGNEEFLNEVMFVTGVQHRNLVKLRGCCLKGNERILVYEYLPNKSLYQALFGNRMILVAKPFYFSLPQFCIHHFLNHFHITWSSQMAWNTSWLFVCVPSQAPWQELRMEIYTLRSHDLIFMSVYIGNLMHKGKFLQCRQWEWATTWLAKKIQDCGGNSTGIGIFAWRVSNPYSPSWH